ncbi:MAG TPA: transposase, partial [Fimbriimonadaceae bacterium]|nr:transposase [Fimbriimonadaceae bacterium]
MAERIPLYYTFGNHMHWVDMEWLWGYHVLPGCVRDMLRLCREAGVKGCVNFDGIGYEKLASEDPAAFADLRQAIQEGTVEVVGGSYGQPYGLFHGGESNVRQRIYGARTARRLFGVPVLTFWEEEFDFFPQLPQILRGVGIENASLFFQWTWHTPEVPREEVPVVWWEGQDGSRLLCVTRNALNLHQWPEDMDIVLSSLSDRPRTEGPTPLVLQWLELMPSPDWMCRSELILPKLRQLMSDERFEVRPVTLGGYLRSIGFQPMGSAAFQAAAFDDSQTLERKQGAKLPHWTRENGIYHVTFRLFDSVPSEVQAEWRGERKRLEGLVEQGRLSDKERFEYQRLLDEKIESYLEAGQGSCLLSDPASAEIVANALRYFDNERYRLFAWCVMPNHVHALVQPIHSHALPDILHSWKSFTSNEINKRLGRVGEVWQREYYDHLVRSSAEFKWLREYVLSNPAKAGLRDWKWVDAPRDLDAGQDAPDTHRLEADATSVRRYTLDQVWHGMTLGKNGDNIRRLFLEAEKSLLAAETLAAVAGLLGRPYAQWDVYPTWELEEAWRELLSAQHH